MSLSAFSPGRAIPTDVVLTRTQASGNLEPPRSVTGIDRVVWLDSAKGIGILLVVLGHCLGGLHDARLVSPDSTLWLLFYGIYVFHMPLFFFLSASLIYGRVVAQPRRVLSSSLTKIAWPYFVWATVQNSLLIAASGVVNHPITNGLATNVIRLFWVPAAQFWFLYALFFLHMTVLLVGRLGGKLLFGAVMALVYVACMLSSVASSFVTSYVSLTCILFYSIGVCFGDLLLKTDWHIGRPFRLVGICGLIWLGGAWAAWSSQSDFFASAALPGAFAGTAAVIIIARNLQGQQRIVFAYLGRQSMTIYVMHVLFVAGSRIVLVQHLHIENVTAVLTIIFVVGILGPLATSAVLHRMRLQHAFGLA